MFREERMGGGKVGGECWGVAITITSSSTGTERGMGTEDGTALRASRRPEGRDSAPESF